MIRRLAVADCQEVDAFLNRTYRDDPLAGGMEMPRKDTFEALVADDVPVWVCIERGVVVGIVGPPSFGERELEAGKKSTFVIFNQLTVDKSIYDTSKASALRIAKELSLAAVDYIQATRPPEEILVVGPKDSRGASWARDYLGMELLEERGSQHVYRLKFSDIRARINAVRTTA